MTILIGSNQDKQKEHVEKLMPYIKTFVVIAPPIKWGILKQGKITK